MNTEINLTRYMLSPKVMHPVIEYRNKLDPLNKDAVYKSDASCMGGGGGGGGATPGEEVLGSIHAVAAHSLLVGSVSV